MVPHAATSDSLDQAGHGTRKRRRVTLACEECRERKRKCDGVKPTCGACKVRPTSQCTWKEARNSRGWWSNSYVQQLQARIKELEESRISLASPETSQGPLAALSPALTQQTIEHLPRLDENQGTLDSSVSLQHHVPTDVRLPAGASDAIGTLLPASEAVNASQPAGRGLAEMPLQLSSRGNVAGPGSVARNVQPARNSAHSPSISMLVSPLPTLTEQDCQSPVSSAKCSEPAALDAMGVTRPLRSAEPGPQRRHSDFYGPSSTISLLHQTRSILGQRYSGQEHPDSACVDSCTSCDDGITVVSVGSSPETSANPRRGRNEASPVFEMGIPPRTEADHLINLFWTYVHSLYPFLHWPSFYDRYLKLWNPRGTTSQPLRPQSASHNYYEDVDDALFHCMLNVVLALGMLHNADVRQQQKSEISHTFFSRAKSLLNLDMLDSGTVPLVQVLLLMGQYLQTRDISTSCWNIVGLAIRVAQGMGLHYNLGSQQPLDPTSAQNPDQLEEEMRKRAWNGCLLLDRILSLTYGRPPMIHSGFAQTMSSLPSAIDDEMLTRAPGPAGSQPEGTNSRTECYIEALKLQQILGDILLLFYNQSPDDKDLLPNGSKSYAENPSSRPRRKGLDSVALQKLLEVDGQLGAWRANLPPHMQVSSYSVEDMSDGSPQLKQSTVFCRQAIVLRARFLYVRMMLLRPFLLGLCRLMSHSGSAPNRLDSTTATMQHSLSSQAGASCVLVAQELAALISDWSHRPDLLPPPWYNVLYVYGSALVLSLGSLCLPELESTSTYAPIEPSWRSCLDFLRSYESQSRSAPRCIATLEHLEKELANYTSGTGSFSDINRTDSVRRQSHEADATARGAMGPFASVKDFDMFAATFDGITDFRPSWVNDPNSMNWLPTTPFFEEPGDMFQGDFHATN